MLYSYVPTRGCPAAAFKKIERVMAIYSGADRQLNDVGGVPDLIFLWVNAGKTECIGPIYNA